MLKLKEMNKFISKGSTTPRMNSLEQAMNANERLNESVTKVLERDN